MSKTSMPTKGSHKSVKIDVESTIVVVKKARKMLSDMISLSTPMEQTIIKIIPMRPHVLGNNRLQRGHYHPRERESKRR